MKTRSSRTCIECQSQMTPVILMDKHATPTSLMHASPLGYRLPDDRVSFWTGKYPTEGQIQSFMCSGCGRIALYGGKAEE